MEVVSLNDTESLLISSDIDDWPAIEALGITVVFDLDGEVDIGIPTIPNHMLYVYFPIQDEDLPDLDKLHALALFGAKLIETGHKLLCHCMMGYNRSGLIAGLILVYLGMEGEEVVERLRDRRPGALYNKRFSAYLRSTPNPHNKKNE